MITPRPAVLVACEARLSRAADGRVLAPTSAHAYRAWAAWHDVVPSVRVLARVEPAGGAGGLPVEGPGVEVVPLPAWGGVGGFTRAYPRARRLVERALADRPQAPVATVPGLVGSLLVGAARRAGAPYSLQVVGDPYEALDPAVNDVRYGRPLRHAARGQLRRQCAGAAAVLYVTARTLQRRYPPGPDARVEAVSDTYLPAAAFATGPAGGGPPYTLVAVGSQEQLYKGHDVLLEAAALLPDRGTPAAVQLVGGGRFAASLTARAAQVGVTATFHGLLSDPADVRTVLDAADLFVLPSRGGEGLPRALVEAMARGLPCLASDVGGVPELLGTDALVPPGDPVALADRIAAALRDPAWRAIAGRRNLAVAAGYATGVLEPRRARFRAAVRETCLPECSTV